MWNSNRTYIFQCIPFIFISDEGGAVDDDRKSVDSYGSVGGAGKGGNDRINVPRTYSDDIAT